MSFAEQPALKRQSCQTATRRPAASTSAATSGGARNGRAFRDSNAAIVAGWPSVAPPSVEGTETMPVRGDQKTRWSMPFGCTTGITPVTSIWSVTGGDHVRPPSSECCTATESCGSATSV